jgi:hypothetical protein
MNDDRTPAAEQSDDDFSVLSILLNRDGGGRQWSVAEVKRARQESLKTEDSIARLVRDGLIHQHGEFVFPARAATRYFQIAQ